MSDQPGARYSTPAIVLHWIIAAAIAVNVLLAWSFDSVPDAWSRPLIDTHKSIGLTVLGLAILRVLWRIGHKPPPLPPYARWETRLAGFTHVGLYGLIFALPITGWIHDSAFKDAAKYPLTLFGVVPWFRFSAITHLDPATKEQVHSLFGAIHTSLAYVLYAMFVMHVAGALKHQFIDHTPSLSRMGIGR